MKDEALPFGVGGGLVAIKTLLSRDPCVHANTAIEMIDAILKDHTAAQPAVQEPVGEVTRYGLDSHGRKWHGIHWYDPNVDVPHGTKLYTTPPAAQRQWVGLTAGERDALFTEHYQWDDYGKAIEAKLKEKNT
jgi:hypothetical protein